MRRRYWRYRSERRYLVAKHLPEITEWIGVSQATADQLSGI